MKAEPECIPCIFRQVLEISRTVAPDNLWMQKQVLNIVMADFSSVDFDRSPAEVSFDCLMAAHRKLGVKDPYREEKQAQNDAALKIAGELKSFVANAEDPLFAAVKLSLAGNIIDLGSLGADGGFDIGSAFKAAMDAPLAIDDYKIFKEKLAKSATILYILDNAGEIVFDKILMEHIGDKKITAVVRKIPVLNDVTAADAEYVSLSGLAEIINTGADQFGVPLNCAGEEFLERFYAADMVISKGQANFETLENADRDIFFLMMSKCACVSRHIGVKQMSSVLLYNVEGKRKEEK